jgi:hypothetical protein
MFDKMFLGMAGDWALGRLREPSTWASIAVGLSGWAHVQFNGDFTKAFINFGIAGAVLLGIALKEGVKK